MAHVVQTVGLTRRFGRMLAVDQLDLQVPEGVIMAFLGPNGAGKTTTIRMLLGLLRPDEGRCEVLGRPPGHLEALAQIGALVEQPSLYEHLTGFENLRITQLMKGVTRRDVDHALAVVGLSREADRLVSTYSLGMRQRLGVALALLGAPHLLILDEPNNGLDPEGIIEMRELMRNLVQQSGVTIFLSSHLLAEVEQVASHVVVIHQGRLRFQGRMSDMGGTDGEAIWIRVDRPEIAERCMASLEFRSEPWEGGLKVWAPSADTPRVVRALVENGVELFELTPVRANLETRFLQLLGLS